MTLDKYSRTGKNIYNNMMMTILCILQIEMQEKKFAADCDKCAPSNTRAEAKFWVLCMGL